MQTAAVLGAIREIYRQASHSDAECRFLDIFRDFVGSRHASMARFSDHKMADYITCGNLTGLSDEDMSELAHDPALQDIMSSLIPERPTRLTEFVSAQDILTNDTYQKILRPVDGGLSVFASCKGLTGTLMTGVCRSLEHDQDFDESSIRRCQLLLPHLSTAFDISAQFRKTAERDRTTRVALNSLQDAIMVLDRFGGLTFANREAELVLRNATALKKTSVGIAALHSDDNRRLQTAIMAARSLSDDGALSEDSLLLAAIPTRLTVKHVVTARPLLVTILPQQIFEVAGTQRFDGHVILHIVDPTRSWSISRNALTAVYKLTSREAELAFGLAQGKTLTQVADELEITIGTARQYLKIVFCKLGIHRQADLLRLGFQSPP